MDFDEMRMRHCPFTRKDKLLRASENRQCNLLKLERARSLSDETKEQCLLQNEFHVKDFLHFGKQ